MRSVLAPLLLCGLCLTFSACETVVDPSETPYVEQMVVSGMLTANGANDTIHFQRTLPLTELYSPSEAALTGVSATILDEETSASYPLAMTVPGAYIAPGLAPIPGHRYTLTATWNGKHVNATTTVPLPAVIDTIHATGNHETYPGGEVTFYSIEAEVRPMADRSFGMAYDLHVVDGGMPIPPYSYIQDGNLKPGQDTAGDGRVHLNSSLSQNLTTEPPYNGTVSIYTYDGPYYDYYEHRGRSYDDDNPFGTSGTNQHWNVQGDGFGIFVSRTITTWNGDIH